jgi:hypothetical protein
MPGGGLYLRFEILAPFIKVHPLVVVDVGGVEGLLNVNDLVMLEVQFVQHLLIAL